MSGRELAWSCCRQLSSTWYGCSGRAGNSAVPAMGAGRAAGVVPDESALLRWSPAAQQVSADACEFSPWAFAQHAMRACAEISHPAHGVKHGARNATTSQAQTDFRGTTQSILRPDAETSQIAAGPLTCSVDCARRPADASGT